MEVCRRPRLVPHVPVSSAATCFATNINKFHVGRLPSVCESTPATGNGHVGAMAASHGCKMPSQASSMLADGSVATGQHYRPGGAKPCHLTGMAALEKRQTHLPQRTTNTACLFAGAMQSRSELMHRSSLPELQQPFAPPRPLCPPGQSH